MIDRTTGFFEETLEAMDPKGRGEYCRHLLAKVVRTAYASTPYFRALLDDAGIDPSKVDDVSDLARLPLTRKAELKNLQKKSLPFGGMTAVPPSKMRRIYVSPGPTFDPEGRGEVHWRWEKALFAVGIREGDIVQNTFSYHLSPAGLMFDEALGRLGCAVVPAGVGNTELQVQVMSEVGVTGYVGTPSFLMTLLEKAAETGLRKGNGLSLEIAMVTGERLTESMRDRFRDEFGVTVRQVYGTADVGSLGYECSAASGMHIPDEIIMEFLDPATGEPVGPGAIGEIVVTLPDPTYPLIRFATGDLAVYSNDLCPCGRTSSRIVRLAGRVDQVTKVKGMFVHPELIEAAQASVPGVAFLQVVVTRDGHDDKMMARAFLDSGVSPSDALLSSIGEAVRNATRMRGEVCFVTGEDLPAPDKRIVDARKWE